MHQKWSTEMTNLIAELKTNERDVKQTMTDLILRNHENAEVVAQVPVLAQGQGQGQGGGPGAGAVPGGQYAQFRFNAEVLKTDRKRSIIVTKANKLLSEVNEVFDIEGLEPGQNFAENRICAPSGGRRHVGPRPYPSK